MVLLSVLFTIYSSSKNNFHISRIFCLFYSIYTIILRILHFSDYFIFSVSLQTFTTYVDILCPLCYTHFVRRSDACKQAGALCLCSKRNVKQSDLLQKVRYPFSTSFIGRYFLSIVILYEIYTNFIHRYYLNFFI